jgi:hypothetical protein
VQREIEANLIEARRHGNVSRRNLQQLEGLKRFGPGLDFP